MTSASPTTNKTSSKELANIAFPNVLYFFANDPRSHSQTITVANPFEFRVKFKVLSTAPRKYKVTIPEGFLQPNSQIDVVVTNQSATFLQDNSTDKLRVQFYTLSMDSANNVTTNTLIGRSKDISMILLASKEHLSDHHNTADAEVLDSMSLASYTSLSHGNSLGEMMAHAHPTLSSAASTISTGGTARVRKSQMVPPQQANHYAARTNLTSAARVTPQVTVSTGTTTPNVSYLVVVIALVCIALLFMPLSQSSVASHANAEAASKWPSYLHISVELKLVASFVLGMVAMVILKS